MSKKKLLTIVLPCVLVVILVAVFLIVYFCVFAGDVYAELNKIVRKNHNEISIKITTEQDGFTLTSRIDVKNTNGQSIVNYTIQNFAPIDANNGSAGDEVVTYVGTVVLKDGKQVEQSGDKVDINFGDVTTLNLYFSKDNFAQVSNENGIFSAKVTAPQTFMDAPSLVCEDMTVTFAYHGSAQKMIVIHYTSQGGAAVTLTYTLS